MVLFFLELSTRKVEIAGIASVAIVIVLRIRSGAWYGSNIDHKDDACAIQHTDELVD
jgi:hypothetical protein